MIVISNCPQKSQYRFPYTGLFIRLIIIVEIIYGATAGQAIEALTATGVLSRPLQKSAPSAA